MGALKLHMLTHQAVGIMLCLVLWNEHSLVIHTAVVRCPVGCLQQLCMVPFGKAAAQADSSNILAASNPAMGLCNAEATTCMNHNVQKLQAAVALENVIGAPIAAV